MFSGIIEEMATIVAIEQEKDNIHFTLSCSFAQDLKIDQSVAHNGVCLTVVRISGDTYRQSEHRTLDADERPIRWAYCTGTR